MALTSLFRRIRISPRLILLTSVVITLALGLCGVTVTHFARQSLRADIDQELGNTTTTIVNMVRAAVNVSVRNYLRAVAEKNLELVADYHARYIAGEISEAEAKRMAERTLLSQTIGNTGYIYCLDSTGLVVVHPREGVLGRNVAEHAFVRRQMVEKTGYLEYDWANPGEPEKRPKALYMTYFEPWDWIISASTYREEFSTLVNAEDFRDKVAEIRLGRTGYIFILDSTGNLIMHPWVTGSIERFRNILGYKFLDDIFRLKRGKLIYDWKGQDSELVREKVAVFEHLPETDWIVAASMYTDEVYAPLDRIARTVAVVTVVAILLAIPLMLFMGRSVTRPVERLVGLFHRAAKGDLRTRSDDPSQDEIGALGRDFNLFMERLEKSNAEMERFIYTVSHDLRSPLITIMGFNGILNNKLDAGDSEGVRHASKRVVGAAQHMHGLLDELLALSRVGRMDNPREKADMGKIVNEVLELLDGPIRESGARISLGTLGTAVVDRPRMMEVFQNLLENAIKYSNCGNPPEITVGMRREGGCQVYYVRDKGCGIEAKYLERIFGLFEQLDKSGEGSGVGLALVKRIIEIHNGRIWAESDGAGAGATFCFTLEEPSVCIDE